MIQPQRLEGYSPGEEAASGPRLYFQGDEGLFFQTWYPVCFSSDVAPAQVRGFEFLDGRIVVFRGNDGIAHVMSAYCPHLGADLAVGSVEGDVLQCAFHRWQYRADGICARTGCGDPAPRTARLFAFPTRERFGIIWAFNGEEPLWELPDFEKPDSALAFKNYQTEEYACDGWVFACNTPDMQHIKVVHGVQFDQDPHDLVEWGPWSHSYPLRGSTAEAGTIDWRVGIHGTSVYLQQGTVDSWWLGLIIGFSCPRPGRHRVYAAIAVERDAPRALIDERFAWAEGFGKRIAAEDWAILNTIRYRRGALTRTDRTLAKFLDYLSRYPRAHPAAAFIR